MWLNRKARHEYNVEATKEVGLILRGGEVKSIRKNGVSLGGTYASFDANAFWLQNLTVEEYQNRDRFARDQKNRPRKILMHANEIRRWLGYSKKPGYTFIPLKAYFNQRGYFKLELALCTGKNKRDKRIAEKEKDIRRDLAYVD